MTMFQQSVAVPFVKTSKPFGWIFPIPTCALLLDGSILTCCKIEGKSATIEYSLEFDHPLIAICYLQAPYIALVDETSTAHFVSKDGILIFSYPLKIEGILLDISSIEMSNSLSLYFGFNTGYVLEIGNFPTEELSIDKKSFSSVLAKLSFNKFIFEATSRIHACSYLKNETNQCVFLSQQGELKSAKDMKAEAVAIGSGAYSDFHVLSMLATALALTPKGVLHLIALDNGVVEAKCFLLTPCSIIKAVQVIEGGARGDWSAVVVAGSDNADELTVAIVGELDSVPFIAPIGLWQAPSTVFPIGNSSSTEIGSSLGQIDRDACTVLSPSSAVLDFVKAIKTPTFSLVHELILASAQVSVPDTAALQELVRQVNDEYQFVACASLLMRCSSDIAQTLVPSLTDHMETSRMKQVCSETSAKLIRSIAGAIVSAPGYAEEILISPIDAWKQCLRDGLLGIATAILRRHLSNRFPIRAVDAFESIAEDTPAGDIARWIQTDMLPSMTAEDAAGVYSELLRRTYSSEVARNSPFDATTLVRIAMDLLPTWPCEGSVTKEVKELSKSLMLLCTIEVEWSRHVSLKEYNALGLEGLVHAYLEDCTEKSILEAIQSNIRPVLLEDEPKLDGYLLNWIQSKISSTIFTEDEDEGDESDSVFSKLVNVAHAIESFKTRARVVLLLIQLPTASHSKAIDALIILAKQVCEGLDAKTREPITEALRLVHLKSVAARYGIAKFDTRNQMQVRAVVNTIISHRHLESSIEDALEFARSYMSPSAVLRRVLFDRALQRDVEPAVREESLESALKIVRKSAQGASIVEDTIHCLLEAIGTLFASQKAAIVGKLSDVEGKQAIAGASQATVQLTTWLLEVNGDAAAKAASATGGAKEAPVVSPELLVHFKAIVALQCEYDIYLSLDHKMSPQVCKDMIAHTASEISPSINTTDESFVSPLIPSKRRLCALLGVPTSYFLYCVLKEVLSNNKFQAMGASLALLEEISDEIATTPTGVKDNSFIIADSIRRICASTVKLASTSTDASLFKPFVVAQKTIRRSLESCSATMLGRALDLFSATDLVLAVSNRLDHVLRASAAESWKICENIYTKDGILMKITDVWLLVLSFSLREIERRSSKFKYTAEVDDDLQQLVDMLHRSENLVLAARVLLSSWSSSASKVTLLRNTMLPLSRKILSYRNIDTLLGVACLSSIPYEQVTRELKSTIPSLQSDFDRLKSVAVVGEELARMYEKEDMLVVFESLQVNSRWLHQIQSLGIVVDTRLFQNPDSEKKEAYLKALVREILAKSSKDLELVLEFCRQYNIESDYASLCYIELSLTAPPSLIIDTFWKANVKYIASGCSETELLSMLRRILVQIHSLDYEKIAFVCSWLSDLLTEDTVHIQAMSPQSTQSNNQVEIDTYMRYVEVISMLECLPFQNVPSVLHSHSKLYQSATEIFTHRLPMWEIMEDPLGMIDAIINFSPEMGSKLFPICSILQLDRDEVVLRKLRTSYKLRRSTLEDHVVNSKTGFVHIFSLLQEELRLITKTENVLLSLRWIYEFERERAPLWALYVLERAFDASSASDEGDPHIQDIREDLRLEMVKFKCEGSLHSLASSGAMVPNELFLLVTNPPALIKRLLSLSTEESWEIQLQHSASGRILSSFAFHGWSLVPRVKEYLLRIADTINDLQAHVTLCPDDAGFSVEAVRKQLLLELVTRKSDGASGKSGETKGASEWTVLATESELSAGAAELRRREDIIYAFSIAALLASCRDDDSKTQYLGQLSGLLADTSTKFTSRHRYRAAQALCFLHHDGDAQLSQKRDYHYCLSETQEIRLTCNTDTLFEAVLGRYDVKPLVFTWLHDEGYHDDVSELCRDVLLVCGVLEKDAWHRLFKHMLTNNQRKAAWHTLCILQSRALLYLLDGSFTSEILEMIHDQLKDVRSKLDTLGGTVVEGEVARSLSLVPQFSGGKPKDMLISLEDIALSLLRVPMIWNSCNATAAPGSNCSKQYEVIRLIWWSLLESAFSYLCSEHDRQSPMFFIHCYVKDCVLGMAAVSESALYDREEAFSFASQLVGFAFAKIAEKESFILIEIFETIAVSFETSVVLAALTATHQSSPGGVEWLLRCVLTRWTTHSRSQSVASILFKWLSLRDNGSIATEIMQILSARESKSTRCLRNLLMQSK